MSKPFGLPNRYLKNSHHINCKEVIAGADPQLEVTPYLDDLLVASTVEVHITVVSKEKKTQHPVQYLGHKVKSTKKSRKPKQSWTWETDSDPGLN